MNLKVEDALKSLSRTDPESVTCPVPKVGSLLGSWGHIPRCLQRKIRKSFRCNTSSACGEVVYSVII